MGRVCYVNGSLPKSAPIPPRPSSKGSHSGVRSRGIDCFAPPRDSRAILKRVNNCTQGSTLMVRTSSVTFANLFQPRNVGSTLYPSLPLVPSPSPRRWTSETRDNGVGGSSPCPCRRVVRVRLPVSPPSPQWSRPFDS